MKLQHAPGHSPPPGRALSALLATAACLAFAQFLPGPQAALQEGTAVGSTSRADYRIEARLEEPDKRLVGKLELQWTNASEDAVQDLWFHLYLNAFSNNRSTHLTEAEGKLRGVEVTEGWGWSQVSAIRIAGVGEGSWTDVFPSFRYRRPDDERRDDRTVFSVDLPQPVAPGAAITVEVEWTAQLPRVRRRTGYKDDFLLVAQWFPKLGVYETGRGWNCHQFHMNTEFYSDYGTYDVTLDLPAKYAGKVRGTGVEVVPAPETTEEERTKVRFMAPSERDRSRTDQFGKLPLVHDFTWTGDTRFEVHKNIFRFTEWAERFPSEIEKARRIFGDEVDVTLRDVDVTVLIHPERSSQADRHFKATSAALFFYGLWFGEYPYQHVTVVDPAWGASAAGGMEYPTLFTCGTRLFTTEDTYVPESVTVHEAGHQFWYGLVGNNEFEAAWLDEGLNSYTDSEVLARVYGPRRETTDFARIPMDGVAVGGPNSDGPEDPPYVWTGETFEVPLPFVSNVEVSLIPHSGFVDLWRDQPKLSFVPQWTDTRWGDRIGYLADPATDPIETRAWEYADRKSYRTNSYPRTAVALRTLQGLVGDKAFFRGMRGYAKEWRYAHPYPADFYASFQRESKLELDWYFRELFQGTGTADWSVRVSQKRRPDAIGYFQSEGGDFLLQEPKEDPPSEDEPTAPWQIVIELRLEGDLRLPLPVLMSYEDGGQEEIVWSREEQVEGWKRIELTSEQKLTSVVIDPDRTVYIDADMSNNQWYDEVDELSPWRWGERVLSQYQRYLHWIGGIGG